MTVVDVDIRDTASGKHSLVCPTCGALTPKDKVALSLVGRQRRIFEIIRRAGTVGITRDDVHRLAYSDDPNGGPASESIISATVRVINMKLYRHGLVIHGKRGPNGHYTLETIPPIDEAD